MSNGSQLLRTSCQRLSVVGQRIATYLVTSEEVFLDTGANLHELSERAGRLVEASATAGAAGTANADPVTRLDGDLRALAQGVVVTRTTLGGCAKGLGRVVRGIDALAGFQAEFDGFAVTLWALAVRMRIESARGAAERTGFATVADDVRRLARLIEPRFAAALERAAALRRLAESTGARARAFLDHDTGHVEAELNATASRLVALRAMQRSAAGLGDRAAVSSRRIAGEVTSILTSLQAHDIARQVLEHVRDALAAPPAPTTDDDEARLADVAAASRLHASQVRHAHGLLAGALGDLGAQLARIAAEAAALAHEVTDLAELRGGLAMIEQIAHGLMAARTTMVEQGARERETTGAMRHIGEAMGELTAHAAAIKGIGGEVKLLALNAQVQALNPGDGARPLAALASAIRDLSVEIDHQIQRVGDVMIDVAGAAAGIDDGGAAGRGATVDAAVASMCELLERLCTQHGELSTSLGIIAESGAALRGNVDRLSRSMAAHGAAVEELARLGAELEQIGATAAARVSPAAEKAASARIAGLAARYTMETERVIHRAMMDAATSAAAQPTPADGGRGASVELF
jgi:hypothetical protein